MSDTEQISKVDAIRQVIEEGGAMDYIDVVNAVEKRFRLDVSSAQVEQVVHDLVNKKTKVRPGSRVSLEMTAKLPEDDETSISVKPGSTEPKPTQPTDNTKENLARALFYVKSVGNLATAKQALEELEAILVGRD